MADDIVSRFHLFPTAEVVVGTESVTGRSVVALEVVGSDDRLALVRAVVHDADPTALELYSTTLREGEPGVSRWSVEH